MAPIQYKKLASGSGILIAALLATSLIVIANNLFTSVRLDLTENKLFTLSPGTVSIISALEEPLSLDLYVSRRTFADFPQLINYANRVRDLLEEYAAKSNGKIRLTIIEPEPFSEEEDQAVASGLNGIAVNAAGDLGYLGLVGTNSTDDESIIPFFQAGREAALEYDLTKLIYNLTNPKKRVVGVISSLPLFGGPVQEQATRPWAIISALGDFFEVRDLSLTPELLGDDIDVLMVAHPKNLSERALFAIDQFILKGGRALLFLDPLAEADNPEQDPANPYTLPDVTSNLGALTDAWGVKIDMSKVAADIELAMRVQAQSARGVQEVDYLPWLRLGPTNLDREDFSTNELSLIHLGSVGVIEKQAEADIDFTSLMHTTVNAMKMERDLIFFQRDPSVMLAGFKSGDERLTLAARLRGKVGSAYPDGPPDAGDGNPAADAVKEGEINVVLVADSDILSDRFWVRMQNFFGMEVPQSIANNGDFVINMLDNLSGSNDLISLRSRGRYSRPFTVVEQIRRDAEAQFRDREQALQARLEETERELLRLQQESNDSELLLTEGQTIEIENFRAEQLRTRKELRAVQHELQGSIERLGTWLKFINIGLIPLLIAVLALGASLYQARRKV